MAWYGGYGIARSIPLQVIDLSFQLYLHCFVFHAAPEHFDDESVLKATRKPVQLVGSVNFGVVLSCRREDSKSCEQSDL